VLQKVLSQTSGKNRFSNSTSQSPAGDSLPSSSEPLFTNSRVAVEAATTNIGKTTDFVTDGEVVVAQIAKPMTMSSIYGSSDMGVRLSIEDFLAKPTIIASGQFTNSDTSTSVYQNGVCPNIIMTQIAHSQKLAGFFGMRMTQVFTLQINANRFQQGRYILAYVPLGGTTAGGNHSIGWNFSHRYSLTQVTQLPHAELDVNCDTQCQLRIPWMSAEAYYSIGQGINNNTVGALGYLHIIPYLAVSSVVGGPNVGYTLWGHFEDTELLGATIPQSGWSPGTSSRKEMDSVKSGPIQSAFMASSKAATLISRVPLISEFAQTAAWALDLAAGVAGVFGFSKPHDLAPAHRTHRDTAPYMQNVDGVDPCLPLALTSINEIEQIPGFASTDIDELSFAYIASIPAFYTSAFWTTSQAGDVELANLNVGIPLSATSTDNGVTVNSFTPLGFISRFFQLWRGSITFTFKIVKTEFHSGRLLLAFNPIDSRGGTSISMTNQKSAYVFREIIDIRQGSEFTYTIPYIAIQNYLQFDEVVGTLSLRVLDELIAPATVNSTIGILIEISGGPDIEFAQPRDFTQWPYLPSAPQSGWAPKTAPNTCELSSKVIGGASIIPTDAHARACMGERITTFRSLLKYWCLLNNNSITLPARSITFAPYALPGAVFASIGVVQKSVTAADIYSHLGQIFMLSRGKVRLHLTCDSTSVIGVAQVNPLGNATSTIPFISTTTTSLPSWTTLPSSYVRPDVAGFMTYDVPAYCKYPSRSNADCLDQYRDATMINTHQPFMSVSFDQGVSGGMVLFRSGSDDVTMGGFVSIPPYVA